MLKKTSAAVGLATVATAGALIASSPADAQESIAVTQGSGASVSATTHTRTTTSARTSDDHRRRHRRHHRRHHGRMGAAVGS